MEEIKKGTTVDIYGSEYTIKGKESPEYIREIAGYVNKKMEDLSKKSALISPQKIAILSAVNITDEYFKLKSEKQGNKSLIREKSRSIYKLVCEEIDKLS
ncbi:MAG: cell division protein ZapA [bacterium]|nr:cell division protein ZapA [bacterium]